MPPIAPLLELAARELDKGQTVPLPLQGTSFTLDSSGVAGFFGGDGAVQGMATVHLFESRRWFGWYNTPGSYEIAKQYGQLANSRFWDGLFPGVNRDPAQLFGLDGKPGPRFLAAHSGSVIQRSSHLAHLIALKAQRTSRSTPVRNSRRATLDCTVTTIDLDHIPELEMRAPRRKSRLPLFALIPILSSIAACIACALVADWWCCASIAFGVLASGMACFVIGSGHLTFRHPKPANGAPPGDGILLDDEGIVVLRGQEGAVAAVTRGRFCLRYDGEPRYSSIGVASVGLTIQFLLQLLFIPQGTLFGQVMFVASLGISWLYNAYLSALDKEDIQTEVLMDVLKLRESDIQKFAFGTRTSQVVFTALSLRSTRPMKLLDELLPNDTPVWRRWKKVLEPKLRACEPLRFTESDWKVPHLTAEDQILLQGLLIDAEEAYEGWYAATQTRPPSSISKEK
ncbi:hypothetical protein OH77DRAFT_1461470 [Trametes cingulata]|nr:hypothetical protein OH77DRAFT_1461470 [Trametes cingulata]